MRGLNFCLVYSQVQAGDALTINQNPDEHIILAPTSGVLTVQADHGGFASATGPSVVVVPPGTSSVAPGSACELVQVFSSRAREMVDIARNRAMYPAAADDDPPRWPDPPAGHEIREYRLDRFARSEGRFGRIFRCTIGMVNVLEPQEGPRDPDRLSPHLHEGFEQCTVTVAGDYVHHLRVPWSSRLRDWRSDEHLDLGSPSALIIPPGMVHTSQAVGPMSHQLIDVFAPPRMDFSQIPGWVLNSEDYPMPRG